MTVAGSVDDFDATQRDEVSATMADALSMPVSDVVVTASSASVLMTITLISRSSERHSEIMRVLEPEMSNSSTASRFLKLPVVSAVEWRVLTFGVPPSPPSPPLPPYVAPSHPSLPLSVAAEQAQRALEGDTSSVPLLVAAAAAAVLLIGAAAFFWSRRARLARKRALALTTVKLKHHLSGIVGSESESRQTPVPSDSTCDSVCSTSPTAEEEPSAAVAAAAPDTAEMGASECVVLQIPPVPPGGVDACNGVAALSPRPPPFPPSSPIEERLRRARIRKANSVCGGNLYGDLPPSPLSPRHSRRYSAPPQLLTGDVRSSALDPLTESLHAMTMGAALPMTPEGRKRTQPEGEGRVNTAERLARARSDRRRRSSATGIAENANVVRQRANSYSQQRRASFMTDPPDLSPANRSFVIAEQLAFIEGHMSPHQRKNSCLNIAVAHQWLEGAVEDAEENDTQFQT